MSPATSSPVPNPDPGALASQAAQALRQSEERYRQLILAVPAALYTIDAQGRITLFNEAAAALWGRRPEVGRELWSGAHRVYRTDGSILPHEECPMALALKEGRRVRGVEILVERPDGRRAWVLPHPEPLYDADGALVGALNMLVDVTERKAREDELRRAKEELEERVLDRTAELEALCFSIAHDLRQHIRGVNHNAHCIAEELTSEDPIMQERIGRLQGSTKKMEALVTDLLAYAKLSRKSLSRERIDVSRLAHEAAANLAHQYPRTEFRIAPGIAVVGDPSLVNVVLHNLMDNACKYSQGQAASLVEVGATPDGLFVRDNGDGFDMACAARIFRPFERLPRADGVPGTGIGLASVQRIVQRHGGGVRAESQPGHGAVFFVSFSPA